MNLIPGVSIGDFILNQNLNQILHYLDSIDHSEIQIAFDDENPYFHEVLVNIKSLGLRLWFHPFTLTLKWMDIYNLNKIPKIKYNAVEWISSNPQNTTILSTSRLFGPTSAPEWIELENEKFCLVQYPGLRLYFSGGSNQHKNAQDLDQLCIKRIQMFKEDSATSPQNFITSISSADYYKKEKNVPINFEVKCMFSSSNASTMFTLTGAPSFTIGSSTQDILSILGPPAEVYIKEYDPMQLHKRNYQAVAISSLAGDESEEEYIWNYFSLGLDCLFCQNTLKKVILHQNMPNHPSFGRYTRSLYKVTGDINMNYLDKFSMDKMNVKDNKSIVHHRQPCIETCSHVTYYGNEKMIFEVENLFYSKEML